MTLRHALTILAVEDLPRALAFYRAVLGARQIVDTPVYAEFSLPGEMRFGLYAREGFAKNTGIAPVRVPGGGISATELYFYAQDLDTEIDRLKRAGARELSALAERDWGDEVAYFADPDGNVIAVARPMGAR